MIRLAVPSSSDLARGQEQDVPSSPTPHPAILRWSTIPDDPSLPHVVEFGACPDTPLRALKVFPGLEDDHLALSLAGKRNRLSSNDFVRAGMTMGISAESARNIVESLCGLSIHLDGLDPASDRVDRAIEVWKRRIEITAD